MSQIPQKVSESVRRLNPHLYGGEASATPTAQASKAVVAVTVPAQAKRVRQRTAPKLNKLETEFQAVLHNRAQAGGMLLEPALVRAQAKKYTLGNGVTYTPDFSCAAWWDANQSRYRETCWEVKGPWITDDAVVKTKMAPTVWPEVRWLLVWKDGAGNWQEQELLPE